MATVTQIASGAWVVDASTVWSTGLVPAIGDDVVSSGAFALTVDSDANDLLSLLRSGETNPLILEAGLVVNGSCIADSVTIGAASGVVSGSLTVNGTASIASIAKGDAANTANAFNFGPGSHVEFSGLADFDNIAVTASTDMPPEIVCGAGGKVTNCEPDNEIALFGDADVNSTPGTNNANITNFVNNQSYPGSLITMGAGGGRLIDPNTDGYAIMTSVKTSDLSVTVQHDGTDGATGVNYSVDEGVAVYGAVAANTSLVLTIPHSSGAEIDVLNWPATSASSGRVGNLTWLICNNNSLNSLDASSLTALTYLYCYSNNISTLDVSNLTALLRLHCYDNNISTLDVSNLTALTRLYCYRNNISVLDVSNLTALTYLLCFDNSISVLDVSSLAVLTELSCAGNSISTLISAGANLSSAYNDIGQNNLSEAALIAFVNSLGTTTTGVIDYGGNPGSAAFETWLTNNPSLDKGYIWLNI